MKRQTENIMNFVYVSVEALLLAVNRWQDIAGSFVCCSRTIHTHRHTHTAGASRIHCESSEDRRFPCSAVINGLIEAGAKMEGGPVCSPLMS